MRCFGGVRVILCKDGRFFGGSGWIWCLYHATADGRLFNYPEHLSSSSPSVAKKRTLVALSVCLLYGRDLHIESPARL
jgi:hypothetical protein